MTWAAATADAARLAAAILERVAAAPSSPASIGLAIYPSPHDFRYLRGADPWSWEHHTAVTRAVARKLKRAGHHVRLVDCTAAGCAAWCDAQGVVASTEYRAAYVATHTG